MAAGEYVSVSSQSDTRTRDLDRERDELATDGDNEHAELAAIYVTRNGFRQFAFVPRPAGFLGGPCWRFTRVAFRCARDVLGALAMSLTAGVGALSRPAT